MKEAVCFNADDELLALIERWQNWLLNERLYSAHTLDGYSRDLAIFLSWLGTQKAGSTKSGWCCRFSRVGNCGFSAVFGGTSGAECQ